MDPVSVGYGATNASLPQQTDAFRGDGGDYQVHFRVTPEHENRSGSWPFEVRFTASYEGREVSWPVTVDPDPPVVTISGPGEPQSGTFEVRFSLSEKNAGFEESDVTVTNGSVTDFSGSERSYTARITPESSGQVTVAVPAGALQDGASHRNKAAQYSVTADLGEPTVSINGVPATISSVDPLQVTFTFSEDVAGFRAADVTVENGSLEDLAGSGADYSATVTPDGGGDLTVTVSARAARGKNNVKGPLEAETATAVLTGPATFITGPEGPLTTEDPFDIRITYLGLSDGATFGASILNATISGEITPGDDGVREVTVTPAAPGPTGIRQGTTGRYRISVVSSWDKGNEGFIGKYVVEVDPDPPVVTISGPSEPQDGRFEVTIDFSEPVSQLFEEDVAVTNGRVTSFERTKDAMRPDRYALTIAPTAVGQVTVRTPAGVVQDGVGHENEKAEHSVTVNPAKPDAPKVQRSENKPNTQLDVNWEPPSNAGDAVTDYDLQYRVEDEEDWTDHAFDSTGTRATISGKGATVYEVRVRAAVGELQSDWSDATRAATNRGPTPERVSRQVAENSPAGTAVGDPVKITDPDGDPLTYSLNFLPGHENDADSFDINHDTGQISVAEGAVLDYEVQSEYVMRVLTHDGISNLQDRASAPLTIKVTDSQPPAQPGAPTVAQGANPATELKISWTATGGDGVAPVTDYDVRYRVKGAEDWTSHDFDGAVPGTTIGGLEPGTVYEVQVLARNAEGDSPWSESVTGTTGPAKLNAQREVPEDAQPGDPVGEPVTVSDSQGRTLVYSIGDGPAQLVHGPGAFTIDSDGQIRVAEGAALDYDTLSRHYLKVEASHTAPGLGNPNGHIVKAIIGVDITVTEVDEPNEVDDPPKDRDPRTPPPTTGAPLPTGGASPPTESNSRPSFNGPGVRKVVENAPAGSPVGGPVTATNPNGGPLTYSLSASDVFAVDTATGRIRVAAGASLDYEDTQSYIVTLRVTDNLDLDGNADPAIDDTVRVTINVIDVDEPPAKPGAPSVTTSSTDPQTALDVAWTAPDMTGKPAITGYDLRYREQGEPEWTKLSFAGAASTTIITGLDADTWYEVQVRAVNDEGASPWSEVGEGTLGVNVAPEFPDGPADPDNPNDWPGAPRSVAENSAAATNVGSPVTAMDPDGDSLTYSMSASDVFDIDTDTGQIRVAGSATLDYEDTQSYTVTVGVSDGKDPDGNADTTVDDTIEITINVTDVDEPPAKPGAPSVTPSSTDPQTALDVAWTAPDMTGKPPITGYDLQYRVEGSTDWTDASFDGAGPGATLTGLASSAIYEVQVRAINDEGASPWSETGEGTTGVNAAPEFPDGPADPDNPNDWPGAPRSVAENSAAGASVGSPVTAADPDGDPLTYSMSASDVFDIDTDTGQIRVAAGATLDYEDTQSYTVTVGVSDGKDPDGNADTTVDDTIEITINVTDVDEPPAAPGAPDLTEPSGDKETSLDVAWTAPDMTGKPSITGYDVQYRVEGATDWTDASFDGIGTGATLTGLASGAAYEVRVRAINDEGASPWSEAGSRRTATATYSTKPKFDADELTLSVEENAPEGSPVGLPVATEDLDGDSLTYSITGAAGVRHRRRHRPDQGGRGRNPELRRNSVPHCDRERQRRRR